MQIVTIDRKTLWLFATPNELYELAAAAEKKLQESKLGDSLIIFDEVSKAGIILKISVNKDNEKEKS